MALGACVRGLRLRLHPAQRSRHRPIELRCASLRSACLGSLINPSPTAETVLMGATRLKQLIGLYKTAGQTSLGSTDTPPPPPPKAGPGECGEPWRRSQVRQHQPPPPPPSVKESVAALSGEPLWSCGDGGPGPATRGPAGYGLPPRGSGPVAPTGRTLTARGRWLGSPGGRGLKQESSSERSLITPRGPSVGPLSLRFCTEPPAGETCSGSAAPPPTCLSKNRFSLVCLEREEGRALGRGKHQ